MPRKLLRDDQWERIKDVLPGKVTDPGVPGKTTGSPWRDLDPALGNWHTTYTR